MNENNQISLHGTPPFPDPANIDETKENLTYYRRRAGYSQRTASRALDMSQANYWTYEALHAMTPKASNLPFSLLEKTASLFKCPPDLIDPAYPANRANPTFRAISFNGEIINCIESPVTDADYANNLNYFLALSRIPVQDIADHSGVSKSSISKWRNGNCNYRGTSVLRVLDAIGCMEFRDYCIKPGRRMSAGDPVTLNDGTELTLKVPPQSIPDLRNNLKYHMHAQGFKAYQIDQLLHLPPGTARRWLDDKSRYFMTAEQARVVAAMHKFSPADISMDILVSQTGFTPLTSSMSTVSNSRGLLSKPVGVFASCGPAISYPASQSEDTVSTYLNYHARPEDLKCARVVGDSMFNYDTGEGIPEGALVLIDSSVKDPAMAVNRVVCWLTPDNEMLIKRLRRVKGSLYVASDNPSVEPNMYPVPPEAVLLGVVVGAMFKT